MKPGALACCWTPSSVGEQQPGTVRDPVMPASPAPPLASAFAVLLDTGMHSAREHPREPCSSPLWPGVVAERATFRTASTAVIRRPRVGERLGLSRIGDD
jgi:hypothetical protein